MTSVIICFKFALQENGQSVTGFKLKHYDSVVKRHVDKIRSHANFQSLTAAPRKISRQHPVEDQFKKQICSKLRWLFHMLNLSFP